MNLTTSTLTMYDYYKNNFIQESNFELSIIFHNSQLQLSWKYLIAILYLSLNTMIFINNFNKLYSKNFQKTWSICNWNAVETRQRLTCQTQFLFPICCRGWTILRPRLRSVSTLNAARFCLDFRAIYVLRFIWLKNLCLVLNDAKVFVTVCCVWIDNECKKQWSLML